MKKRKSYFIALNPYTDCGHKHRFRSAALRCAVRLNVSDWAALAHDDYRFKVRREVGK